MISYKHFPKSIVIFMACALFVTSITVGPAWGQIEGEEPSENLLTDEMLEEKDVSENGEYRELAPTDLKIYYLKPGDILWDLANNFDTSPDELKELNAITDVRNLRVGEPLLIPTGQTQEARYTVHRILKAEEIWNLAEIFEVDPFRLLILNNIRDYDQIYPGRRLIIPVIWPEEDGYLTLPSENEQLPDEVGLILPDYRALRIEEEKSLADVAELYDLDADKLSYLNGLTPETNLTPEQKILLPLTIENQNLLRLYLVPPEVQSIGDVAGKFGFEKELIIELNPHIISEQLVGGQLLYLPSIKNLGPHGEVPFRSLREGMVEGSWPEDTAYSPYRDFRIIAGPAEEIPRAGEYSPDPVPVPEIDFDRELLIFAYLGEYPTTGYGIEIEAIEQEKNELLVYIKTEGPAADQMVGQAITHPYTLIAVPREKIPSGENVVRFIDQNGNLLARAELWLD